MLRIALYHDFLVQMGGAERVTEVLHRTLPGADLLTTMYSPRQLSPYLRRNVPKTTWMQRLPAKNKLFRHYFMLYPLAVESANLTEYDLVISSCFGFAKGVRRRKGAVHICYCHNPMRWVWRTKEYLEKEEMGPIKRRLVQAALKPLRSWEMRAATRPDYFIANSTTVADRLKEAFGIDARVIPPPIETRRFKPSSFVDDYFLILSRLSPYKQLDVAVEACTRLNLPLIVIGDGPDRERLTRMAGPTVTFLGRVPDDVVNRYAKHCRALLFPGEEDFGIAPLEVNAAGRPVIALKAGGALDTVIPGTNGLFFDQPTAESLMESLKQFETMDWDPIAIRAHAEKFDTKVFQRRILDLVEEIIETTELRSVKELVAA